MYPVLDIYLQLHVLLLSLIHISLETGEADIAYDIDPIDMDMVKNNPKLKADQNSAMSMTYLGFNTQRPPFDKKEVRQAIAYAADVDSIIAVSYTHLFLFLLV